MKLRILIVQETNWIDRNVIHQHHLAERLVQRGHEVRVIDYDILWREQGQIQRWQRRRVFQNASRVVGDVNLSVIRPTAINLPLLTHANWALNSLWEMRRLYREFPFDVVIGLSLTNSYPMALLLQWMKIPYINMLLEPYHTMMPERWTRAAARQVERLALRAADGVVVFTPKMRDYACDMGASPENVSLLKTGVSLELFHPGVDGSSKRQALSIAPSEWVLFFMGWLYDFSGLRQIVDTIAQDPGILEGARLLIVGDGDLYQELREKVTRLNLSKHILLTGRRPYNEIPHLLAAADVCLLPSLLNETTRDIVPMKVYEYLAAGKPVVGSQLPGLIAEFGKESGILYADGPIAVLRQALSLAAQPALVQQLGQRGRQTAENNADWNKTTGQLEQILLSMKPEAVNRNLRASAQLSAEDL